jgi:hypothetical protein
MRTDCDPDQLHVQGLSERKVVAAFDGETITSEAGALLLREIEAARGFLKRFCLCFVDHRDSRHVEHSLSGKSTLNRLETFGAERWKARASCLLMSERRRRGLERTQDGRNPGPYERERTAGSLT